MKTKLIIGLMAAITLLSNVAIAAECKVDVKEFLKVISARRTAYEADNGPRGARPLELCKVDITVDSTKRVWEIAPIECTPTALRRVQLMMGDSQVPTLSKEECEQTHIRMNIHS
ncbi:hypothetical protein [Stenotrophobium rhamnosiphilum]|nr:hypothetical protein [Stenotrophobium rhamnosiphilum]